MVCDRYSLQGVLVLYRIVVCPSSREPTSEVGHPSPPPHPLAVVHSVVRKQTMVGVCEICVVDIFINCLLIVVCRRWAVCMVSVFA